MSTALSQRHGVVVAVHEYISKNYLKSFNDRTLETITMLKKNLIMKSVSVKTHIS